MTVTIDQDFKYEGNDYWRWWIWLEGAEEELDQVDHVIYTLHSTFPNPVRTVTDRASKFKLETAGWGVFRIYAKVVPKSSRDTEQHLEHDLELSYPDESPAT